MANSDCIIIQGSNMAEAHPVGFQWVMEAKARGARIIHIDPRFTRTSALADTFVPIRVGTDIIFLGAIINYVMSNELDFREYLLAYSNAATVLDADYLGAEDLDGLFSGFDPDTRSYDTRSWQPADIGERDETLQHPRCVYQVLKRHYSRYTPEMVAEACGVTEEEFLDVARAWVESSGRQSTTALVYSVG